MLIDMKSSLSPPVKLAGFAAALVVVLGASFGVARAVAPDAGADHPSGATHGSMPMNMPMDMPMDMPMAGQKGTGDHAGGAAADPGPAALPGLAVAQSGYRLVPESTVVTSGPAQPFRFRLLGPDRQPVPRYDQLHEREVHLIVVRRDLTGFQHLHPARQSDGGWAVTMNVPTGGTWRAFADFEPSGGPGQLTLGVDIQVSGAFEAGAEPTAATRPDPAVTVRFDRQGDTIQTVVLRAGVPIQPDPYLGARGHLVALRAGDLAYLHVHPEEGGGPPVRFSAKMPTAGTYALFFDYQVDGTVRTAATTTEVK